MTFFGLSHSVVQIQSRWNVLPQSKRMKDSVFFSKTLLELKESSIDRQAPSKFFRVCLSNKSRVVGTLRLRHLDCSV